MSPFARLIVILQRVNMSYELGTNELIDLDLIDTRLQVSSKMQSWNAFVQLPIKVSSHDEVSQVNTTSRGRPMYA